MTETPPFSIVDREGSIKPFVERFQDAQIFNDLAELLNNDEKQLAELRRQIADYLNRIIVANLEIAFGQKEDSAIVFEEETFLNFMLDLVSQKSGENQIQLINEKLRGGEGFWSMVEMDLHEQLLQPLKTELEKE